MPLVGKDSEPEKEKETVAAAVVAPKTDKQLTQSIASAKARVNGALGWVTRRLEATAKLVDQLEKDETLFTKVIEERVAQTHEDLCSAGETYMEKFNELMELLSVAAGVQNVDEEIAHYEHQASKQFDKLSDAQRELNEAFDALQQRDIDKRKAAIADPGQNFRPRFGTHADAVALDAMEGAVGGRRARPNEALKPKVLQTSDTPRYLALWLQQYRAYHDSSGFDRESLDTRKVYFRGLISEALWIRIEPYVTRDMPIVAEDGIECVLDILKREFLKIYPLFTRRLDFFSYKMEPGQTWSSFSSNQEQLGNMAELDAIGVDELYSLLILTSVSDDELRKEFLRLEDSARTHAALKDLGQRLETARATKKRLTQSKGSSSANAARGGARPKTTGGQSGNQSGGGGDGKKEKKKEKKNQGGSGKQSSAGGQQQQSTSKRERCKRCGYRVKKEEMAEHKKKCPCTDDSVCTECNKKGHWAPVCPSKKKD